VERHRIEVANDIVKGKRRRHFCRH
jgi:hypothetical protein